MAADRGQVSQLFFIPLYDLPPEKWQNSIGKMYVLSARRLKEAIPTGWNRFW